MALYLKSIEHPPEYYDPGEERYSTRYLKIEDDTFTMFCIDDYTGRWWLEVGRAHLSNDKGSLDWGTSEHPMRQYFQKWVNYAPISEQEFLIVLGVL